eukprot:9483611-Pyramimonas_sp.AAC.1
MYLRGYEAWLAIYLSQHGTRLNYHRMWRHGYVVDYCLKMSQESAMLQYGQCQCARGKIESFLHSGNLLSRYVFYTRIPHDKPAVIRAMRDVGHTYLQQICARRPLLLAYFKSKLRVVSAAIPRFSEPITQHNKVAAAFAVPFYHEIQKSLSVRTNLRQPLL